MIPGDFINGCFEGIGGLLLWQNVWALRRDKIVRGVRVLPVVFWSAWGFWNLYYYPSLGQWFSFWGGLGVVIPNALWVGLAIHYTRRERASQLEQQHRERIEAEASAAASEAEAAVAAFDARRASSRPEGGLS